VARLSRAYEALLRRLIEQGRAAGAFRAAVEPALAVKAFTGMCNAAAASHRPDARTPLEDYIAAFTALILHGLTGDT
jgi:hypothetical protein